MAAAEICDAEVSGHTPGSMQLSFHPRAIRSGNFRFSIGTAGSCTLVLQTVLPALWYADASSTVEISGGTHNSCAPPADFLIRSWLPVMEQMQLLAEIELTRHGFYPAGGGVLHASITPNRGRIEGVTFHEPEELCGIRAIAIVAGVARRVAERELQRLGELIEDLQQEIRVLPDAHGPGNALLLELIYRDHTELFSTFGEKGIPARTVADRLFDQVKSHRDSGAAISEHLSDQLVLPMALAGEGSFTTDHVSAHLATNMEVIEKFLPVEFKSQAYGQGVRIYLD
jgi:RNA 3'-terminal phosphate cyclase (ATP)